MENDPMQILAKGMELEYTGDGANAIKEYQKAIDILIVDMEKQATLARYDLYFNYILKYIDRIEEIKKTLPKSNVQQGMVSQPINSSCGSKVTQHAGPTSVANNIQPDTASSGGMSMKTETTKLTEKESTPCQPLPKGCNNNSVSDMDIDWELTNRIPKVHKTMSKENVACDCAALPEDEPPVEYILPHEMDDSDNSFESILSDSIESNFSIDDPVYEDISFQEFSIEASQGVIQANGDEMTDQMFIESISSSHGIDMYNNSPEGILMEVEPLEVYDPLGIIDQDLESICADWGSSDSE
ncbi:uncharacterized protein LOC119670456 [Teleopsis dalmanni]|uniref:uncharacterized protein LOC119670456 n=1 Tax=Teleopsis dalmanni TaxID=139649 RepID=UPI0018CD9083|nr:uncharacterized protein LOC119670456 [Teleopsis dalmanni]XP_037936651.1 uncharacterized protein LOC119670456 [Teleopsis dalmanni]XP_037936652.1 uncharacterized protein LOC119670456 [Teleopsis dalmanni]